MREYKRLLTDVYKRQVRLSVKMIGEARVTALMYRPKLIGGERAHYSK